MPNWVYNHLELHGDELAIANFKDLTRYYTFNEETDETQITYGILSTLLPTPTELIETVKGSFHEEQRKRYLEIQRENNLTKYGYADWYDWNYAHWGCKWSDCETELLEGDTYTFSTPWSPPITGIKNISKMFPAITFILSFTEEANHFIGACLIVDGMMVEEEGNTDVVFPFLDDEDWSKYDQAKQDERQRCVDTLFDRLREFRNSLN